VIGRIDLERLIFLDESGVSTQMTRLYARCTGGARIHETTPDGRWKILTILGAISTRGMIATMTVEAATDREIFLAYLDEVLCPKLRPGDVMVMDNLSSHKVKGVRERIETVGAQLLYLPPYSPDLNPIEKAWAKLKQLLRAVKARTQAALDKAIARLLPLLTAEDAKAWFRKGEECGYAAMQNLLNLTPIPDAVFCYNDIIASGAHRAVFEAGLTVPGNVALIGVSNLAGLSHLNTLQVSLSTVDQDVPTIAAEAIRKILEMQGSHTRPVPSKTFVSPRLIIRNST
jgi:transposase